MESVSHPDPVTPHPASGLPTETPAVSNVTPHSGGSPAAEARLESVARQVLHQLSRTEQGLLNYLVTHAGRAVSRDELLKEVWHLNPTFTNTRTVDMHVAKLRKKLEKDPANPTFLQTVRGTGYLVAPA